MSHWWMWLVAGLVLAGLEALVPAWAFLGFALGALAVGLLLLAGGPLGGAMAGSAALTLAIFAVLSLVAFLALRAALGVRRGQVKTFDRDINDG